MEGWRKDEFVMRLSAPSFLLLVIFLAALCPTAVTAEPSSEDSITVSDNWFSSLMPAKPKAKKQAVVKKPVHQPLSRVDIPKNGSLSLAEIERRLVITNYQLQQMAHIHSPGVSRSYYYVRHDLIERFKKLQQMKKELLATQEAN